LPAGNHRQLRCYCPLWPEEVAAKQESIPWQSFVFDAVWSSTIRNTSLGPVAQALLPVVWGWAMTIFNLGSFAGAEVCPVAQADSLRCFETH
jgi:hypothetical protein